MQKKQPEVLLVLAKEVASQKRSLQPEPTVSLSEEYPRKLCLIDEYNILFLMDETGRAYRRKLALAILESCNPNVEIWIQIHKLRTPGFAVAMLALLDEVLTQASVVGRDKATVRLAVGSFNPKESQRNYFIRVILALRKIRKLAKTYPAVKDAEIMKRPILIASNKRSDKTIGQHLNLSLIHI